MTPPTFLLIGAQKSGTSWLAAMLRQHPDVFVPGWKELHFFNIRDNYEKGIDWYLNHFSEHSGETAVGECTPNYLWVSDAPDSLQADRENSGKPEIVFQEYPYVIRNIPELVHNHFPDLKLIVALRNPVDRARSSYYHAIRSQKVSPRSRLMDIGGQQGILGMGFYYRHLLEWQKFFPADRFLVLVYEEDIVINKEDTLRRVFRHLEIDESFTPENLGRRYNERSSHLYMHLHYYFPNLSSRLFRLFPALHKVRYPRIQVLDSEIKQLNSLYRTENQKLEQLLGRSLAIWNRDEQS